MNPAGRRPLLIPAWPEIHEDAVRLFQSNNGLAVDGDAGPVTRRRVWPTTGNREPYAHLAPYPISDRAKRSHRYVEGELERMQPLVAGLRSPELGDVVYLLSSGYKTGFDYLSTQDSATVGLRRLAGSTLFRTMRDLLATSKWARSLFGTYGVHSLSSRSPAASLNNGWPLCNEHLRAGFLALASAPNWWAYQLDALLAWIRRTLNTLDTKRKAARLEPWRMGRMLALALRTSNSSPRFPRSVVELEDERTAYTRLAAAYSGERRRGRARVKQIEALIGEGEQWR